MVVANLVASSIALVARSAELHTILCSSKITDASGAPLDTEVSIAQVLEWLRDLRGRGGSLYLVGNGGSAAVAGHAVTDFVNVARLRATTLHDSSLITCMANDYGYENAFSRILSTFAGHGDILIAISSSGNSQNIRNAAIKIRELGGSVITLSGFASDNPLRSLGDLNIWLDTRDYGMAEIGHQFILHNVADRLRLESEKNNVKQ